MIAVEVAFSGFRTKSRKNNRRQFYESVACILNKFRIADYLIHILDVFVPWRRIYMPFSGFATIRPYCYEAGGGVG